MVIPMKITSVETDGGASEGKNEITARERMRLRLVYRWWYRWNERALKLWESELASEGKNKITAGQSRKSHSMMIPMKVASVETIITLITMMKVSTNLLPFRLNVSGRIPRLLPLASLWLARWVAVVASGSRDSDRCPAAQDGNHWQARLLPGFDPVNKRKEGYVTVKLIMPL